MSDTDNRPAEGSSTSSWPRILGRIGLGLAATVGAIVGGLVLLIGIARAVAYPNLPEIGSLTDYRPKLPMRIFSADGVLLGEFGEERSNFLPIGELPQAMQDAGPAAAAAKL